MAVQRFVIFYATGDKYLTSVDSERADAMNTLLASGPWVCVEQGEQQVWVNLNLAQRIETTSA